jgi:hypothetical protein
MAAKKKPGKIKKTVKTAVILTNALRNFVPDPPKKGRR